MRFRFASISRQERPARFWCVRLLGILTALFSVIAAGLAVVMAMMSAMLFDAPGSEFNPWLWALALGVWAAPVVFLVGLAKGIDAARRPNFRPLAIAWGWIAAFAFYLASAALLLGLRCGGEFTCS